MFTDRKIYSASLSMFSNLNDLRSCVIKHQDKVIIGRKLPSDVLDIIVNQFGMGCYNQSERTQNFFSIFRF